jgi:hypothetical protein
MRIISLIVLLLICTFGCEKSVQTDAKSFELTMERNNAIGPCNRYSIKIESDGKVDAARSCLFFVECEGEFNGTSFEKARCPRDEWEKVEKQLSDEEIKELINEINSSEIFSFENDYSYHSKSCSQITTDFPNVVLTIKINGKKKTIEHYYGCWVNNWSGKENALQPLTGLENKINNIAGTESWTRGQK